MCTINAISPTRITPVETTKGPEWKNISTSDDNTEVPVTSKSGRTIGYITAADAAKLADLSDKGYKIVDANGLEVKIGKADDITAKNQTGDISNRIDSDFRSFLSSNNGGVNGKELLEFVNKHLPDGQKLTNVDDAVKYVLRNTTYDQAAKGSSIGNGGETINFLNSGDKDSGLLSRTAIDNARNGGSGMTLYEQTPTGGVNIKKND
jgi:hypothetical protein